MTYFKKISLILTGVLFCFSSVSVAGSKSIDKKESKDLKDTKDTLPVYKYISDDPILEMIDSLATVRYLSCAGFTVDTSLLNTNNYKADSIPMFTDEDYVSRISKLKTKSPFPYSYNADVKAYISFYAYKKRKLVSRMLGLAQLYFPLFESVLDQYKMPLELKYLAIVESALNPFAVSRVGATGLWQFMYHTGKMYDLNVTSYVDERYDPYKETVAACEFMQDLYNLYGDWALVLAAYNSGPGNVNKAIRRSGGKTSFWDIKPYLPKETQGYVPAFIAVSYIMNYASDHNIYPLEPKISYHKLDTIQLNRAVSFEQISAILKINEEDLRFLNPSYKTGFIPQGEGPVNLVLPNALVGDFVMNDQAIYSYVSPKEQLKKEQLLAVLNVNKNTQQEAKTNTPSIVVHTVKKGQHLSMIASKYNCDIQDLKKWNNIKSNSVMAGQRLKIYNSAVDKDYADASSAVKKKNVVKTIEPKTEISKAESSVSSDSSDSTVAEQKTIAKKSKVVNTKSVEIEQPVKKVEAKSTNESLAENKKQVDSKTQHKVEKKEVVAKTTEKSKVEKKDQSKSNEESTLAEKSSKKDTKIEEKVGKKEIEKNKKKNEDDEDLAQNNDNKKTKQSQTSSKFKYHTVQKGDTLWSIANRYKGVTVEELRKFNRINDAKGLRPGDKIKVPVSRG